MTDETALRRVVLLSRFAGRNDEVIHDGTEFRAPYSASSTRTAIAGGFRFRVRRTGGWPSSPSILPLAVDTSGNVAE